VKGAVNLTMRPPDTLPMNMHHASLLLLLFLSVAIESPRK
jgi:hypothetical protein